MANQSSGIGSGGFLVVTLSNFRHLCRNKGANVRRYGDVNHAHVGTVRYAGRKCVTELFIRA